MKNSKLARVGLGPITSLPSWQWIGQGMVAELRKYFDVGIVTPQRCPEFDAVVLIKVKPPAKVLDALHSRGTRILYFPVDRYRSAEEIRADAEFLRRCSAVLIHCERLRAFFAPLCPRIHFVEHHNRFGLPRPAPYRKEGPCLWVGGFENIPYLLNWSEGRRLDYELVALTNFRSAGARRLAGERAAGLGIPLREAGERLNGVRLVEWTENRQRELLASAKAAIDIKGSLEFNQLTKPPTKAQKYVASGIPFAVNAESYSAEYLAEAGFEVAAPEATEHWFSESYWEATSSFAPRLRARISIEAVGRDLATRIEQALSEPARDH